MTTENKMIRINDIEAAKKLVSAAVKCPFDIDIVSKGKIFIDFSTQTYYTCSHIDIQT